MMNSSALQQAQAGRLKLQQSLKTRWYPRFHIAAPAGWINDPNGLCYFQGRYHAFYQHYPYGPQWGPMHWGHASSEDLIHWTHLPVALAPDTEDDADGVWSGSAIVGEDGLLYAFYTGHRWRNPEDTAAGNIQKQCLAISRDGTAFEKKGAVVTGPAELSDYRDPKVWKTGGTWYMTLGVRTAGNRGEVWLYSSADLYAWTFACVLYRDPNPDVYMLECPDFFPLGGKWVLLYGPMGLKTDGYMNRNGHNCGYVVGDWQEGGRFTALTEYRPLDWGHNFYAPQSMLSTDGRRLIFGWLGAFHTPIASQAKDGWSGQFAITRELFLDADLKVRNFPIAETDRLRDECTDLGAFELGANEEKTLSADFPCGEILLEIDLSRTTAERIGLRIMENDQGAHTLVCYDDLAKRIELDRRLSGPGDRGTRSAPYGGSSLLTLRVLIDKGSVEVFANQGEASVSSLVFPADGARKASLVSESGTTAVRSLKLFTYRNIWQPNVQS